MNIPPLQHATLDLNSVYSRSLVRIVRTSSGMNTRTLFEPTLTEEVLLCERENLTEDLLVQLGGQTSKIKIMADSPSAHSLKSGCTLSANVPTFLPKTNAWLKSATPNYKVSIRQASSLT
jgi:hypothetical protein